VVGRLEAAKGGSSALAGEALRRSPLWDQGMDLGLWPHASEAGLLPLWNRTGDGGLWGFLAFARESAKPFQAAESELLALYSGIVQVSLENAELIQHLGETSRALAESYERVESAYLELQKAQRALAGQERRALVGDLFLKMAQRLQAPVAILHKEGAELDRLSAQVPEPLAEPAQRSLNQMRSAVARVDGLVRALQRRAGQDEPSTPEWIHLHDLLVQELELMQAEGHLPQDAGVQLQLEAANPMIFGVYSDFAEVFVHLLQNAELGARGDGRLAIRTTGDAAHFRLEVEDHGPCILETDIAQAFQPFSGLREGSHGERLPGAGLPASQQLMAAYGGKLDVQSEPGRTVVGLSLPLEG
jgi:signal transduction histidine kinase